MVQCFGIVVDVHVLLAWSDSCLSYEYRFVSNLRRIA